MVELPSNGTKGSGYLSVPASGEGPGVVVIQEWWGLNDQIKEVCDRFAEEGFVALAPDLYRGKATTEPEQAGKDMAGAVDFLAEHEAVTSKGVGVTGFCMGGALALLLATLRSTVVAVAPYYGTIGWPSPQPDWSKLNGPVQGHYAEDDDSASPEAAAAFADELRALGKDVEVFVYPGTEHAFANHHRAEVHVPDASDTAFRRTVDFFRANVR